MQAEPHSAAYHQIGTIHQISAKAAAGTCSDMGGFRTSRDKLAVPASGGSIRVRGEPNQTLLGD